MNMIEQATTKDAYQLFHEGTLALARAERQGIRLDVNYCEKQKKLLTNKINRAYEKFKETKLYHIWNKVYKDKTNLDSNHQLGYILYHIMKIEPPKLTVSGKGATDEEALMQLDLPELKWIKEIRKFKKIRDTYLDSFLREQNNGYLHPFFNLHTVKTYRSCVAKGTKILVVRDFEKYPDGVPIEEVKAGDYVYCFDDNLNPTIQKVVWAGKTGHREVVRIHWVGKGGHGRGYLDVTPEHLIRLIDGTYQQAQKLDSTYYDYRSENESKHLSKVRVLSCSRVKDTLVFTGRLKNGKGLLEHHLIYEHFNRKLKQDEIVHHKNGNHFDHSPSNLEAMSLSLHAKQHMANMSPEQIERCTQVLRENRHKLVYKYGDDNPNSLCLSRWQCLRILAKSKGHPTKVPYDFETFKKYLKRYGIGYNVVSMRYDKNGKYISKGRLIKLSKLGISYVQKELGFGYYRLKRLYEFYNIPFNRKWANQFGEFKPGNHIITKVEWLHKEVDVYDIEVEKYHNFIANEICVHNSCQSPNIQNIPRRDAETMAICRRALYARPGHQLVEIDYHALEVSISACINKDPNLIRYLTNPESDMHGDMAIQIFMLYDYMNLIDKAGGVSKVPEFKVLRDATKNGFVFPQFYGDYYGNNAVSIACDWCKLPKGKWRKNQGIKIVNDRTIGEHFIEHGIKSLDDFIEHMKKIEHDFWHNKFGVYGQWREDWYREYQRKGYFDLLTGFRCSGIMRRNEVVNYPVQGAAFHCLLKTFIEVDKIMRKENWDSRLVGQIHDSILLDVHPDELEHVIKTVRRVATVKLPRIWKWIIVSLSVEADVTPVDGSWADKKEYDGGI